MQLPDKGEIKIFQTEDEKARIEVRLEKDTVWLNQNQMVLLFESSKANISEHIKAIFDEGELTRDSTVRKFRTVQKEGNRKVIRNIEHYNLDVIISVGYRIKSKRGTQFRIWANSILKEYLIKGYALNNHILKKQNKKLMKLNDAVRLLSSIKERNSPENKNIDLFLTLLNRYRKALGILDDYDNNRIRSIGESESELYVLNYDEVIEIIKKMKEYYGDSDLFGKELDKSLKSSISVIYQTFQGKDLYPSIEEKASHLLYFLVKNHSFVDGNKRIAAAVYVYFLEKNGILSRNIIDNNLLATITLLIANSHPSDKELIINIITVILRESG